MLNILKKRAVQFILVFTGILLFSVIAMKFLPFSKILVSIAWIAGFIFIIKKSKKTSIKVAFVNITVLTLLLSIYTIQDELKHPPYVEIVENELFYDWDEVQGYKHSANIQTIARKSYNEKDLYRVTYTIDENGHRVTPPYNEENNKGSVIFLGCSFSFGDGVEDDENYPYLFGKKTNGDYKVYNFGVSGYGPHSVLGLIEFDQIDKIVEEDPEPKHAILFASYFHIIRMIGNEEQWYYGPIYRLDSDNKVVYKGQMAPPNPDENTDSFIVRKLKGIGLIKKIFFEHKTSEYDVRLFGEVISEIDKKIKAKYPGIELHVLMFDSENTESLDCVEAVKSKGLNVHLFSDILHEIPEEKRMIKYDGHPTPESHEKIADYIVNNIVK